MLWAGFRLKTSGKRLSLPFSVAIYRAGIINNIPIPYPALRSGSKKSSHAHTSSQSSSRVSIWVRESTFSDNIRKESLKTRIEQQPFTLPSSQATASLEPSLLGEQNTGPTPSNASHQLKNVNHPTPTQGTPPRKRKFHSTETAPHAITDWALHGMDKGDICILVLLDLSKCFDVVLMKNF